MEEKSIKKFFLMMKKRSWLIIALTIIPMIISSSVILFDGKIEPEYKASTTLMVGGPKDFLSNGEKLDYDTYKSINGKVLANFNELVQMEVVVAEVINNLGLDMTYKEFKEKMNVEIIGKTEIMKIETINKDRDTAEKIINEIVKVSSKKAKETMGIENIEIIDNIHIATMPVKSKTKIRVFAVGALGFMVSILIILLIEYMDNTIKTPNDVEEKLNLPVVGILQDTEDSLVIYEKPDSFVAENYRSLVTNIRAIKESKDIKSILITSSNFKEEKSIVSTNIATAIAQVGEKVLLVDGNLRKPNIHKFFNMDNDIGLSNILNGETEYNKAIKKIEDKENLYLISSGSDTTNPAELLGSNNMENLIEKLEEEYDFIILNGASLGAITDSVALSTIVDGTILICESEKTKIQDIEIAKEILEKINTDILGVTINKVHMEKRGYYKYYYDSYSFYEKNK